MTKNESILFTFQTLCSVTHCSTLVFIAINMFQHTISLNFHSITMFNGDKISFSKRLLMFHSNYVPT